MSSVIINRSAKVVSVIEPDGPDEIIQGFEPVICLNVDAVFVGIGIIQSEEGLRKLVITERVKRRFCHKGTKSSVILLIFPFHEGTDKTILEDKTNTVFNRPLRRGTSDRNSNRGKCAQTTQPGRIQSE